MKHLIAYFVIDLLYLCDLISFFDGQITFMNYKDLFSVIPLLYVI